MTLRYKLRKNYAFSFLSNNLISLLDMWNYFESHALPNVMAFTIDHYLRQKLKAMGMFPTAS